MAYADTSRTAEYRRFQTELADEISPDEASAAEDAFRRGRVALWSVAAGWAALVLLAAGMRGSWAEAALSDLAGGALVPASLFLGARYRVPLAGRLLLTLSVLKLFAGGLSLSLYSNQGSAALMFAFFLPLFWWLGWLLDRSASAEARLRHPRWGVGRLWIFALLYGDIALVGWLGEGRLQGAPFPVATLLAAAVAAVWPWWPGPWIERGRIELVPDAELLLRAATKRGLVQLAGRVLAVLFAVFPLFLVLCHLGLQEDGLQPPADAVASRPAGSGGTAVHWYWPRALAGLEGKPTGRYLAAGDLGPAELYVTPAGDPKIAAALAKVAGQDKDAAAFAGLRQLLAPFRLDAPGDLAAAQPSPDGPDAIVRQLVQGRTRPGLGHPEGEDIHFAVEGALIPLTHPQIELLGQQLPFAQALLIVCGGFSFLLLWRRGGDSPAARWLAVCLAGTALVAAEPYMGLYLPAIQLSLWVETLQSPLRGLLLGAVGLLEGLGHLMAFACPFLFAAVLVHVCWPPPADGRWRWLSVLGRALLVLLALLVPAGLGTLLGGGLAAGGLVPDRFSGVATPGFLLCAVAVVAGGAWLRRRNVERTEVPELGILAGLAFFCFQVAFWIALLPLLDEALPAWNAWVGIACVVLFALLGLVLVVRRDFLHLSAGRDLGQILLIAVLPVVFEKSEDLSEYLMADALFASDAGKSVLGLLIVLALFAPVQKLLERYAAYLAVPGLRKVERAVKGSLEWLVGAGDVASVRAAAAGFFADLEVAGALLYRRAVDGRMERLIGPDGAPEALTPSERLRGHLAEREGAVIDLAGVHLSLRHFFLQHELARLERDTGGRYLLPICLGASLRGLLLLPDGAASRRLCRDLTGAEVGKLGLVVTETGRLANTR